MATPPIFMFGFERSGTTLLSMMVGAHPEIAVPFSATGLWYRYEPLVADRYNGLAGRQDLERLVDDLLAEERISLWDERFGRDEVLAGLSDPDWPAVVARFHALYAARKGKPRWGNIDIATLYRMDRANAWFPDARFVHIVRDGCDVALSHWTYAYGLSNTGETADRWREDVGANLKMGAMLPAKRYHRLRYEDLVLDSEATLRRLCAFLDVEFAPEMLDYAGQVEEKIPQSRQFLWPAIGKPPVAAKAYRWKREFSRGQRVVFEWKARDLLDRLGYETYGRVPRHLPAYPLELWYTLTRGHRFRRLWARARRQP